MSAGRIGAQKLRVRVLCVLPNFPQPGGRPLSGRLRKPLKARVSAVVKVAAVERPGALPDAAEIVAGSLPEAGIGALTGLWKAKPKRQAI